MLFVYTYLYPRNTFIVIAFVAGMIIGFVRSIAALQSGATSIDQWDWVIAVRDWFAARISALIPEPGSQLGVAYLLGIKDALPATLNTNLKAVGLSHIVVASGAHLSILVEAARKIFGRISRFASLFFSILFIVLFMVMVGWTPSILRAGIMSILGLLTWYVGRRFAPWRIILITITITLLIDPTFCTNLGWLLSFASFIGVMILGPAIQKFLYGGEKPNAIASIIITTVAATIATLPLTLYFFGSISLISIVANLLILPTLPYAMGAVFLVGCFADVPILREILAFVANQLLSFHIGVVNFFAEQKFFIVQIPTGNLLVYIIYVVILLIFLVPYIFRHFSYKKQPPKT